MSSTPMRPCYSASFTVKFPGNQDRAEKFLSGAMLARRLNYFKDLEDDPARWDPNDGLRTYRYISDQPRHPRRRHPSVRARLACSYQYSCCLPHQSARPNPIRSTPSTTSKCTSLLNTGRAC